MSMLVAVGLTYRFAPLDRSAEVVLVDLDEGRILGRRWFPPPIYDLTPGDRPTGGGRQRGARGVAVRDGRIFVATFDAVHVLDPRLKPVGTVTCERFCDIHEILPMASEIIVTSTRMDAIVWCSESGRPYKVWCATEDPALLAQLPEVPFVQRNRETDWRAQYPDVNPTHLNAVSLAADRTFVAFHNQAVLWCVEEGRVWHDARPAGAGKTHNHVLQMDGRVVLNDTLNGVFFRWGPSRTVRIDVSEPGCCPERPALLSAPWAVQHGWLRGLASLGPDRVVVGQCPAKLVVLALNTTSIVQIIPLDDDWRVSVNGIAAIP